MGITQIPTNNPVDKWGERFETTGTHKYPQRWPAILSAC